jgi:hypothetical protein
MSDINSYSQLQEDYPQLTQDEIDALTAIHPDAEKFTLGGVTINNPKVPEIDVDYTDGPPPAGMAIGGFEGNTPTGETVDDSWEVNVLGVTMNDRDDVYTVSLVVVVALLVYAAKVGIDHWFNKRLELFKKKIGTAEK